MKYKYKVILSYKYYIEKEVTVVVERPLVDHESDEEKAHNEATDLAMRQNSTPSSWDAEHYETTVEHAELISAEPAEGEEPIPIRCDKTLDMGI